MKNLAKHATIYCPIKLYLECLHNHVITSKKMIYRPAAGVKIFGIYSTALPKYKGKMTVWGRGVGSGETAVLKLSIT